MSVEMDTAIALFSSTDQPSGIKVNFYSHLDGICKAELDVLDEDGKQLHTLFDHNIRNLDKWTRFGAAIGRSKALRILDLSVYLDDDISSEVHRCVEAFYSGLTKNGSIEKLKLSTNVFSGDGSLPILDLNNAQFKDSVKEFEMTACVPISNNESIIISPFLENTSLATFNFNLRGRYSDESAFRRIVSACYTVNKLRLTCRSDTQYASIASLLGNDRSVMEELQVDGTISKEQLSTIAAALVNNSSLKKLKLPDEGYLRNLGGDLSPMTKTLCNASSIEAICVSNHTLQDVYPHSYSWIVLNCLKLNKTANKDEVIRKKIARYYFVEDFDISPFAKMPVSLLPEVLSMIRMPLCHLYLPDSTIQSAIFRILKYFPELCNASSRDALHNNDDEYEGGRSGFNKRSKVSK